MGQSVPGSYSDPWIELLRPARPAGQILVSRSEFRRFRYGSSGASPPAVFRVEHRTRGTSITYM